MRTTSFLRLLMTVDAVGGVWTYALDLAAGLATRGVETVLSVLGPPPDPDQIADAARIPGLRLVPLDFPLEWLACSSAEVEAAGVALLRLARECGADLVHLNTPGLAAFVQFDVPLVVACHSCVATWWRSVRSGPMPAEFEWRAALVAGGYHAADLLVAPSAGFAAVTRATYGLPATPLVVYNGRRIPEESVETCIGSFAFTAGRLWDEGKDTRTLDHAAARLSFPVIAAGPVEGPNATRADLRHLRLLGRLPGTEVARWLAARPIFVSTARYEPFGLSVLEAAQTGCALVLADTAGFRELWGDAAVFVAPGDVTGFADAMRCLMEDGERRAGLGVAAKERARRYSIDTQADAMLAAYRRLINGGGGQARRNVAA
jgi:glycosyltransferase involved in cell wall biosynthesis